jgi:hypothetical protein
MVVEDFGEVCKTIIGPKCRRDCMTWSQAVWFAEDEVRVVQSFVRCQEWEHPYVQKSLILLADYYIRAIELYGDIERDEIYNRLDSLQESKGEDYGSDVDPLYNIRSTEDYGLPGWAGACIRANDKLRRIQSFQRNGQLQNESLEDALIDSAVYYIHALRLYRELTGASNNQGQKVEAQARKD